MGLVSKSSQTSSQRERAKDGTCFKKLSNELATRASEGWDLFQKALKRARNASERRMGLVSKSSQTSSQRERAKDGTCLKKLSNELATRASEGWYLSQKALKR